MADLTIIDPTLYGGARIDFKPRLAGLIKRLRHLRTLAPLRIWRCRALLWTFRHGLCRRSSVLLNLAR